MQRNYFKKFKGFFFVLALSFTTLSNAAPSNPLEKADSNFKSKKFTEAAALYDSLFQSGSYSSQMLLKQAYIAEASNEPDKALYHLALFNKLHQDRIVLDKMEALAIENNIKGFEISDRDLFMIYFHAYYPIGLMSLIGLGALLFVIFTFKIVIQKELSSSLALFTIFIIAAIAIATRYSPSPEHAIAKQSTVVVSAPSAGGEPVALLNSGDRCLIDQTISGWAEVEIGEKEGYVLAAHLAPVALP